jgi:hypothetical protein
VCEREREREREREKHVPPELRVTWNFRGIFLAKGVLCVGKHPLQGYLAQKKSLIRNRS